MKLISNVTKSPRVLALVLAAAFGFSATNASAADSDDAYDNIIVTQQVSANGAKRMGRRYLQDQGFSYGLGAGAARIKSITRDGDTWILHVRYSLGGLTMNQRALLYVGAHDARVSELAPERKPELLASQ